MHRFLPDEELTPPPSPVQEPSRPAPQPSDEAKRIELRLNAHALARYCTILDLQQATTDLAQNIYKTIYETAASKPIQKGHGLIAACMFLACRYRSKSEGPLKYAFILGFVRLSIQEGLDILLAAEIAHARVQGGNCYGDAVMKPEYSGVASRIKDGRRRNIWRVARSRVLVGSDYDSRDLPLRGFCCALKEGSEVLGRATESENADQGGFGGDGKVDTCHEDSEWVFVGIEDASEFDMAEANMKAGEANMKAGEANMKAGEANMKAGNAATNGRETWSGAFKRCLFG